MAKYGKINVIKDGIFNYNIGLIGESGIGKSTLAKQVCEMLVGVDGYMALDISKEDGYSAINGAHVEQCLTYKKWDDVTKDIIKNKKTDYPNLKVLIIDTIDELFKITEPEVVRLNNIEFKDKVVTSINAAYGGFQRGEDKVIDLILDRLWALKRVGVSFFLIGHTKRKENTDAVTEQSYSMLTTNISQRYFTAIRTKLHVLGIAYIDRSFITEKVAKTNSATKDEKEKVRNKVVSARRKIAFRDDSYVIDSKSRLPEIEEVIDFDAKEFIRAIEAAIAAEKAKKPMANIDDIEATDNIEITPEASGNNEESPILPTSEEETVNDNNDEIEVEEDIPEIIDEPEENDKEKLIKEVRLKFRAANIDTKKEVKKILADTGSGKLTDDLPAEVLKHLLEIL